MRFSIRSSQSSEPTATMPPIAVQSPSGASVNVPTAIAIVAPPNDTVDHRDHAAGGEELLAALQGDPHVLHHAHRVVMAREHEVTPLLPRDVEVVVANPVDRSPEHHVLHPVLDHPNEREQAERVQRRQHGEGKDLEGVAGLGDLADEPQRHQGAGHGADVESRPG